MIILFEGKVNRDNFIFLAFRHEERYILGKSSMSLLLRSLILLITFCTFVHAQELVVDDRGEALQISQPARRIVSLTPSVTETLFAIGAGDQVIGVTDYCNYPEEAKAKQKVGGVINPNIEAIVALEPDLIVLSMEGNVREDFTKMKQLHLPLFATNPRTLPGIHKSLLDLGILTGHKVEAQSVVASMRWQEDSIVALGKGWKKKGIILLVSLQPIIVAGGGTFLDHLISLAGGVNLASDAPTSYPALSREAIVSYRPGVMIVMSDAIGDLSSFSSMYPEWKYVPAVQNGKVFSIDSDISSRPGPRAVEALEKLFSIIHQ
ncbi:MAG TPA: cobalamin-binding protein [Bacteroidota bacterium]